MAGASAWPRRARHLSLLLTIGVARAYAQSVGGPSTPMENLDVSLALRTARVQYEQGEEPPLLLWVENRGNPRVSLWRPDLTQRTVVLEVLRDGLAVEPEASWDARPALTHITLRGGESRQQTLELSRLFPTMTLPPGRYEVRATVHAGPDVEMETNALPFEIVEMPPDEQAAFADYLRAVGGGEYSDVVEMGTEFLERHPGSRFADALRLELGFAQAKLGDTDGAIATYGDVVTSPSAAAWRKREAAFQTAWVYPRER